MARDFILSESVVFLPHPAVKLPHLRFEDVIHASFWGQHRVGVEESKKRTRKRKGKRKRKRKEVKKTRSVLCTQCNRQVWTVHKKKYRTLEKQKKH